MSRFSEVLKVCNLIQKFRLFSVFLEQPFKPRVYDFVITPTRTSPESHQ